MSDEQMTAHVDKPALLAGIAAAIVAWEKRIEECEAQMEVDILAEMQTMTGLLWWRRNKTREEATEELGDWHRRWEAQSNRYHFRHNIDSVQSMRSAVEASSVSNIRLTKEELLLLRKYL